MPPKRRPTRQIRVGSVPIGGDAPVSIQSMTTTRTPDARSTVDQVLALATAGADIIRITVPDDESVDGLALAMWVLSSSQNPPPIIADIHFRHDLALKALELGVDALRLNPGNIKDPQKIRDVAREAKDRGIPIRVGANAGSLHTQFLERHGGPTPEALVESALWEVALLEEEGFNDIKISVKHSDAWQMVQSYRLLSEKTDHPLHLGVTEAGTAYGGSVKSAVGIGTLLAEGIGDTIRVSLAADPLEEVKAGKAILQALGLRREGVDVVACPTCGRVEGNVIDIATKVEEALAEMRSPIQVAVMGCLVNGPGEARGADVGLALTKHGGTIFRKGQRVREVGPEEMLDVLLEEVQKTAAETDNGERKRLPVVGLQ
ncbi:MAG TPA: flavodoxin-dependent (E)-4-hydroxy-3-methylbut-2-enyl-diphosphate synthase [Actinomycetota bacterium]|jgi:(E)-4-hydroxy-3-methylbut-2-enyl-diphosphate synthase|nr:flavodoxin-dependent (E)-4-hydroxy-3-methylbut-2-enyl-diphosphate synthase [Actinomycetota bacterium]